MGLKPRGGYDRQVALSAKGPPLTVISGEVFWLKPEAIVEKLKNGDTQAFRFIYELFYKAAFKAAFFIARDPGLAEDAVHEAFLKVPSKIGQLEDPSKLGTWLRRMSSNAARDIVRQRSKSTLFDEAGGIYSDNQLTSPEMALIENEDKLIIMKNIDRLQPDYKIVIQLKYYQEMTIDEISTALGIPVGTVKSRLFSARKEIKKLLEPEDLFNRPKVVGLNDPEGVK